MSSSDITKPSLYILLQPQNVIFQANLCHSASCINGFQVLGENISNKPNQLSLAQLAFSKLHIHVDGCSMLYCSMYKSIVVEKFWLQVLHECKENLQDTDCSNAVISLFSSTSSVNCFSIQSSEFFFPFFYL